MNNELDQTQKLLRSGKLIKDEQGRTVLSDTDEAPALELMSTQMLKTVIDGNNAKANADLRKIAEGESGLVARDIDKDRFEVITDDELQKILDGSESESFSDKRMSEIDARKVETVDGEGELDLVSTQMLRVALNLPQEDDEPIEEESFSQGFDPYNSG